MKKYFITLLLAIAFQGAFSQTMTDFVNEFKGAEKAEFYDVKSKSKVAAEVIGKVQFDNGRFALKGKLTDGRVLYRFVTKAIFDKSKATVTKPAAR